MRRVIRRITTENIIPTERTIDMETEVQEPIVEKPKVTPASEVNIPDQVIVATPSQETGIPAEERQYREVDWDAVIQRVETIDDYSLLRDQMSIPTELKKLEEAGFYRYRWLDEKSDRFHEQLDAPIPWEVVNRNNSPEVPERYFSTNGAIRKGSNLILARMHRKAHDLRQRLIWKASETPKRQGSFRDGMEFEPNNTIKSGDIVVAAEDSPGNFVQGEFREA